MGTFLENKKMIQHCQLALHGCIPVSLMNPIQEKVNVNGFSYLGVRSRDPVQLWTEDLQLSLISKLKQQALQMWIV